MSGHLFQGRYKGIPVRKQAYLLELTRYVVLNPVRARMVADPADWPWCSDRSVIGEAAAPSWLDTDWHTSVAVNYARSLVDTEIHDDRLRLVMRVRRALIHGAAPEIYRFMPAEVR
ncbi:MAG: transposase [Methylococcales bacterium]